MMGIVSRCFGSCEVDGEIECLLRMPGLIAAARLVASASSATCRGSKTITRARTPDLQMVYSDEESSCI